ncbi:hypothetical protein EYF80_031704 [Liparis tanakae]|uniref:Uncharacterized protein n=1 Tax=Liparis tanakae TaxID=230148 RepID=A0A4Z2GYC3_9TELE|nr:hypothetical protein EYF80_031704 [Liparis tanakae]
MLMREVKENQNHRNDKTDVNEGPCARLWSTKLAGDVPVLPLVQSSYSHGPRLAMHTSSYKEHVAGATVKEPGPLRGIKQRSYVCCLETERVSGDVGHAVHKA